MDQTQADIQEIITNREMFLPMIGKTILITGATGYIGSMLAKTFIAANPKFDFHIKVIGHIRSIEKAQKVYGEQYNDIEFTTEANRSWNYIVHTVSPTTSKFFIEHPVETIKASVESTIDILEIAKNYGATMVYLSSMEQYGTPYVSGQIMTEEQIGIINHLNVRSSYSESKRLCECLCASYANEYGVNVKIARLAQTFGSGISLSDNRMPMQFAKAVVEKNDIILHTEGHSYSNFVYITDAISGIIRILNCGAIGEAYNVCNDLETRSIIQF